MSANGKPGARLCARTRDRQNERRTGSRVVGRVCALALVALGFTLGCAGAANAFFDDGRVWSSNVGSAQVSHAPVPGRHPGSLGRHRPTRLPSGSRTPPRRVKAKLVKRCKTRHHVRTCTFRRGAVIVKICRKRRHHREHCVKHKQSQIVKAFASGRPAAKIAARLGSGYTNPLMPAVVRTYFEQSPVPTKGDCTGTIVQRGVILTAAHCLFANHVDGNGQYGFFPVDQMWVAPGNHPDASGRDVTEYGVWRIARTYVPTGWQQDDGGLDWGIIVVAPDSSGHYPGDYTGTYAARWDAQLPVGTEFFNVGYPASGGFRTAQYFYGGGQYFCDTTWDPPYASNNDSYTNSSYNIDLYPCEMNGGASGGPVFAKLGDGTWWIVGVNNRGVNRSDGYGAYGITMYMDDRFGEFWRSVQADINASGLSRDVGSTTAVSSATSGEPRAPAPGF
jgi:Trypsin-like peptidase domain